ncbi:unnamed protein product, partial [Didymodactylos carnosus]
MPSSRPKQMLRDIQEKEVRDLTQSQQQESSSSTSITHEKKSTFNIEQLILFQEQEEIQLAMDALLEEAQDNITFFCEIVFFAEKVWEENEVILMNI